MIAVYISFQRHVWLAYNIIYNDNNKNNNDYYYFKQLLKIRLTCDIGIKGSGNTDVLILKIAHDS